MLASMERLTGYLSDGAVTRLPPVEERTRLLYRDMYGWQSDRAAGGEDVVHAAERTLADLPEHERESAIRLLLRLVRVARVGDGAADQRERVPKRDHDASDRVLRALSTSGVVHLGSEPAGDEYVELSDDLLVKRWPTLRRHVEENRTFLLWRQQLNAYQSGWLQLERDRSALLSGRPLLEALEIARERPKDLSAAELDFIEQSHEVERQDAAERAHVERSAREAEERARVAEARLATRASHRVRWMYAAAAVTLAAMVGGAVFAAARGPQLRVNAAAVPDTSKPSAKELAAALLIRAGAAATSRDFYVALARYDSAITLDSGTAAAFLGRSSLYESRNLLEQALIDADRAVALDTTSAEAFFQRGVIARQVGQKTLALDDLNRSLRLQPGNAEALFERGLILEGQGQSARAADDYSRAIQLDSGMAAAYGRRGALNAARGRRDAAERDFRRALTLAVRNDSLRRAVEARLTALVRLGPDSAGSVTPPPAASPSRPRVRILYAGYGDAKKIADLYLALSRRGDWRVAEPERVPAGSENPPDTYDGVRYYFAADRSLAQSVGAAVALELCRQGGAPPRLYRMKQGLFKASPGLVEVWVAALSNRPRLPAPEESRGMTRDFSDSVISAPCRRAGPAARE